MTSEEIMSLEIQINDTVMTVRDYFKELALKVWTEEEGFSGKRPWGNGGWKYDLYAELIRLGVVEGKLDEYGYVEYCDNEAIDRMLIEAFIDD